MDRVSLILVIIGAINWGLIALFQFDLVAAFFRRAGCFTQPGCVWPGRFGWLVLYHPAFP